VTADDQFRRAAAAHAADDAAAAEAHLRALIAAHPAHADALALLGHVLAQTDRREEALPPWRQAAALRPGSAAHRYNLAELLRRLDRHAEAEAEFRAALALSPGWAEAHFGLANALKALGRVLDALAAYGRAIDLEPGFARALYNRANLLREAGRVAAAERDYRSALASDPGLTDAVVNRAAALGELHRWAEAEECYRQALARRPADPDLAASLAGAVLAQGRTAEGAELLRAAEVNAPDPAGVRFRRETLFPAVPESVEAIAAARDRLAAALDRVKADPPRLDPARLHHPGLEPPMALAYQVADPRPLLEAYAALYAPQIPPLDLLPPAGGRPRIGVVVTHGHEGVYDRCLGRLVERVAAAGTVAVTLVCSPAGANVLRHLRPAFPGDYLVLPPRVDEAAARVRDARFDLLHYWEVGTDATNYFLPFFRPAPVQCATWGWPVTTGNPRVDWYVSAAPLEPADGDAHYTERLARLASLPTCYERPPAPPPPAGPAARRRAFGLDAGTPVYLFVQNVRKPHPDFDMLLGALLEADRRGRVVLLADEQPGLTEAVLARLRRALGPDARRVGVVARQDRGRYLRLVSSADVLLDTPPYGAGANTLADAVACGTPVVTLPGLSHRGRWAAAVLEQAGLAALVTGGVGEYVAAAVRLAADEDERRRAGATLREFGQGWFDDLRPAGELEAFWLEVARDRSRR
jgi:predicted O-linked N-acetylglucosamine transferase (SPINDLY family)